MFTLSIPVTASAVDAIKLSLTEALPDIKSSHRCEALARGLGYRTYASLLADTKSGGPTAAVVDGAAFIAYLAQHDFQVSDAALYQAAAGAALQSVLGQWPTLNLNGFGAGDRQRRPDGQRETSADRQERIDKGRIALLREQEAFLACLAFLSRIERTKTIRSRTGSYSLKHLAENYACTYPGGEKLGPVYVPNGVFIAAAIHAGFKVRPDTDQYGLERLNATFNMSRPSIATLEREIRPDGTPAQFRGRLRRWRAAEEPVQGAAS